ncbi:hypothetical protein RAA17_12535 [Komagataeibacter rhaeticus]|nr:hypothetical protein [Komagataeibacter rhaeticus]
MSQFRCHPYGGSGVGNGGTVWATDQGAHGQPCSCVLTLPPLAALYLHPAGEGHDPVPAGALVRQSGATGRALGRDGGQFCRVFRQCAAGGCLYFRPA